MLEEGSFYGRTMDYAWMLFLSALSLLVRYAVLFLTSFMEEKVLEAIKAMFKKLTMHLCAKIVPFAFRGHAILGLASGLHSGLHLVSTQSFYTT